MTRESVPCVLFEDEHLLVVKKPAGMNTHAPSPFAGEGIYEWLRNREPRWATLAIIHRLDKETSGVIAFAKTPEANRSLTEQFAKRRVQKRYRLLTDRKVRQKEFTVRTTIFREGDRYLSGPAGKPDGEDAETRFRVIGSEEGNTVIEAEPVTGRTHQIRVHANESGFPILGDTLYGGSAAGRVCLHAEALKLRHPLTGKTVEFAALANFNEPRSEGLRAAIINPDETNAFRLIHGASDGRPEVYVDRVGDFLLVQSEKDEFEFADQIARGFYHKKLNRHVRKASAAESAPRLIRGEAAPEFFPIRENGIVYEVSFAHGYSSGLFFDQRDNRRRILKNYITHDFPVFDSDPKACAALNTFAYTCGFSVCTAKAGVTTTSVDLSKKYLEWGKRNFALNGIDLGGHDFIYGDVFGWLRRLHKKERFVDLLILDPPTFSESKEWGAFQAQLDYGKLVTAALPLLRPGGVMLASTNAAGWKPEEFLAVLDSAIGRTRRTIQKRHYAPQPPDFPVTREEPAYLKTVWLRIG